MEQEQDSKKSGVSLREEKILNFWNEHDTFKKSLNKESPSGNFVFYDGPPFATGLPHYGHVLASVIKDTFPRYETMKGKRVRRVWGWDCHGLPIENLIEKSLDLKSKKDIEEYGIDKFNHAAEESVLTYASDWKSIIPRIGRWVDMENDYRTMDASYTESIWWAFKKLHDKGLIYEGYKAMHLCPRCETTLSNFEVGLGYKDITDISVYVKFALKDEPETFVLAWTTTPWTLAGNVALAVGNDISYVKIISGGVSYILAKERVEHVLKDKEYSLVEEYIGADLVGKNYTPIFDYYASQHDLPNKENGWKIVSADFVTTTDGTGIVHIAPAYGEDDMSLGKLKLLPFIQHVGTNGQFKDDFVHNFKGMPVKPIDNHQATDIEIIKWLAHNNHLFEKQKIVHSYPHCWRCQTPLLNYASSSWFVRVTDLKDKLVEENKKILWVPEHIKEGRFGKWLENARDWAISRSRYWGAPLPVWKCASCDNMHVMGSLEEIKSRTTSSHNSYVLMRHAEAESNITGTVSCCDLGVEDHLTSKGITQAQDAALGLKDKNIDMVIMSPFMRVKETVELFSQELNLLPEQIITDERLVELNAGDYNGKTWSEYQRSFNGPLDRFTISPDHGETLNDVKRRVASLLYELETTYQNKTILIVSHGSPLWLMTAASRGYNEEESIAMVGTSFTHFGNAEFRDLPFTPLPHNNEYELDVHRPYIDRASLVCTCGESLKRVEDVFDCWFESGSMPYAQFHYPFENEKEFEENFPSDFIAEGLDQTRGWFYSLLVLGVGLFDKSPYKRVIVNGLILAEDGQKMSKSLKNYPDLIPTVEKYGADALRFYLLSSPAMRGEELRFSEKDLGEVYRKVVMRLDNVYAFYALFRGDVVGNTDEVQSSSILDAWILARLNETLQDVNKGMESFELDRAVRPIDSFIDDLSTWYVRRSRERFKGDDEEDKKQALATTRFVLCELSKIIAPFIPFTAEDLYQNVTVSSESVHLESWPQVSVFEEGLISNIKLVRDICTLGNAERKKLGIPVRQPLRELKIGNLNLHVEYLEIIKDELNVKNVAQDKNISLGEVSFDTEITPELKREGDYRELIRGLQDARKKEGLMPSDTISFSIETNSEGKNLIEHFESEIKKVAGAKELVFRSVSDGHEIVVGETKFSVSILK